MAEEAGTVIPGEQTPIETKARGMGWMPKEEFKGDEKKWRPAEEFVERGENILPIVKERLGKLEKTNQKLAKELSETHQSVRDIKDFFDNSRKSDRKKAYQEAFQDIEAQQRAAVEIGDTDSYDDLQKKKLQSYRQFTEESKAADAPRREEGPSPEEDQRADEFIKDNDWFRKDKVMHDYALNRSFSFMDAKTGEIDYDELKKDVAARFSDSPFFNNQRRDDGSPVETGGTTRKATSKRSFDDLPQSAKDSYAKFHKSIPTFTKEAYLADYQWD